jgi:hypothetical protein
MVDCLVRSADTQRTETLEQLRQIFPGEFMLPDAQQFPAFRSEKAVHLSITGFVTI